MSRSTKTIAFDIETTGFAISDQVTVIGFALPLGCRVFIQTDGRQIDQPSLQETCEDTFDMEMSVTAHQTETDLLKEFSQYVTEAIIPRNYVLVGYNGETYKGGFDLPFLRTRCIRNDVSWPFHEPVEYVDLLPIFRTLFNTQLDTTEHNDLDHVYTELTDGDLSTKDPFESSKEAVTAFENGAFTQLVHHNIVDILQTKKLTIIARKYCSKSEFRTKSLTPWNNNSEPSF
ncbi:MAG: ribonuclease H-like domain-containing protein [Halobacteriaceae archaeon]